MTAMTDLTQSRSGFVAFLAVLVILVIAFFMLQERIGSSIIGGLFPGYTLITDAIPGEWIVISRSFDDDAASNGQSMALEAVLRKIRLGDYNSDPAINTLIGKQELRAVQESSATTLFFINPSLAFSPLYVFLSGILAFLLSLFFPATGKLSWIRGSLMNVYRQMEFLLRKQFDSHYLDFEALKALPPGERELQIRTSTLPDVVISELEDFLAIGRWMEGRSRNPIHPLKFYFRYHISPKYGNLIQGLVSGGAAILIFVIGLRGLKLIPPEEPSLILMSLSIEFILLIILMINFAGSAQEERLDRVLKELEAEQRDAIGKQTESLQQLISAGSGGGGRGREPETLADFEERRILDELLALMIRQSDRLRGRG